MRKTVIILAAAFLVGCGVDDGADMSQGGGAMEASGAFERINGVLVPPEPDPSENNKTIEGIDLDKNGVRDDMDRWAANKFGHVPAVIHPIHMLMKAEQMLLVSTPSTKEQAIAIYKDAIDYGFCGHRIIDGNGLDFGEVADESHLRTFNTRIRIEKLKQIRGLAGMFFGSVDSVHKDCMYPQ